MPSVTWQPRDVGWGGTGWCCSTRSVATAEGSAALVRPPFALFIAIRSALLLYAKYETLLLVSERGKSGPMRTAVARARK
jgi:hypothetical protein